jgi:uncharacterized protein
METILITGGTGFIGTALTGLLTEKGYRVIILSRRPRPAQGNISYATWNPKTGEIDRKAVEASDHVIHLAGANVGDKRWTAKRKKEIVDSRVDSGRVLVKALQEIPNKVRTVISASGVGWYGPDQPKSGHAFVESDPAFSDFLGTTCTLWEETIKPVASLGIRLVILRTAIVLSNEGGAFPEFVKPMNAGVAGILGSGDQVISWIHIADIARLYLEAIVNENYKGVYNAAAPEYLTNKEFTLRIARARKRPFIPVHVPVFALKIWLGEMSIEVLKSATVDITKLRQAGFRFLYPGIDAALNVLIGTH